MAELIFDREPLGTPYDRDGELTEWVAIDTTPTAADGQRFPAREFSAGGYRGTDALNQFTGLQGISLHAVISPDYTAMFGAGRRALAYRGHGGPTAAEYWAWGVELERVGLDEIKVFVVHQDQLGAFVSTEVGAYDRTTVAEWVVLSVSRETTPAGFDLRVWLDGHEIGTATVASSTAATLGEPVTLGCRIDAAEVSARQWLGRIERVVVSGEAATAAEVAFYASALVLDYEEAFETWRAYFPRMLRTGQGDAYGRYRVRPVAETLAWWLAAVERWEVAGLPPQAYGEQLAAFEVALGIQPAPTDTIAARQAAAQAALAGAADLSPSALQAVAASLFGVADIDVEIFQGRNYFPLSVVGAGELLGPPWRVRGPVDATREVGGLTMSVPAGRDIRVGPFDLRDCNGVFLELATHHDPAGRETDHGLAATFASVTGLAADTWVGLALRTHGGLVWWVALDSAGLALRSYDPTTGLSARTDLDGAAVAPLEIVVEWVASEWVARWRTPGTGPGNWSSASLAAPTGAVTWLALAMSSASEWVAGDLTAVISAATFKAGDAPSWAYWQAYTPDPILRDLVAHSGQLDSQGRAVSYGSATYQEILLADTDGAGADVTPTVIESERLVSLSDTAVGTAQITGVLPTSLWNMQNDDDPTPDSIGTVPLNALVDPGYQSATGPDGLFAHSFAVGNNRIQAASTSSLDVSGDAVFVAMVIRTAASGVVLSKESATTGWRLRREVSSWVIAVQSGATTVSATLTDGASGYQDGVWSAVAVLVSDAGGTPVVVVATSGGATQGSAAVATSNAGRFALGEGVSGASAAFDIRWVAATDAGEADALDLAAVSAAAARLAAAAGVA